MSDSPTRGDCCEVDAGDEAANGWRNCYSECGTAERECDNGVCSAAGIILGSPEERVVLPGGFGLGFLYCVRVFL